MDLFGSFLAPQDFRPGGLYSAVDFLAFGHMEAAEVGRRETVLRT